MNLLRFRNCFSLDSRSLGVFRVFVAGILILDAIYRVQDIEIFYTRLGVLSFGSNELLSLFRIDELLPLSLSGAWTFFSIKIIFAICLLVGFWVTPAAWGSFFAQLFLLSLNDSILNRGDYLLLNVTLLMCLLPVADAFSLSHRKRGNAIKESFNVANFATASLIVQIIVLYSGSALHKFYGGSWSDSQTVLRVFLLDFNTNALGAWVSQFDTLLKLSTFPMMYWELIAPFFLLAMPKFYKFRLALILTFILFQASLASTMFLGVFPWISTALVLATLPSEFWNRRFALPGITSTRATKFKVKESIAALLIVGSLAGYSSALMDSKPLSHRTQDFFGRVGFSTSWMMFKIVPRANDWNVVIARTKRGISGSLLRQGDVSTKPERISEITGGVRWRKFLINVRRRNSVRLAFLHYLCKFQFESMTIYGLWKPMGLEDAPVIKISKAGKICQPPEIREPLTWPEKINFNPINPAQLEKL